MMWSYLVNGFLVLFAVAAASEPCSPKSCKHADSQKPVCGSDGISYPNRCNFERTRCHNKNVTLVRRGSCKDEKSCMETLSFINTHSQFTYKPQCKADGSFAPTQCHPDSGYCWCVTAQGIPLPYTTIRWKAGANAKPRCGRKKNVMRRRSGRQHKRRCKQDDKAMFNNNLIKIFYTEWSRYNRVENFHMSNETDRTVVFWKFDSMDRNKDHVLDKSEYKDLQKIVRKAVRPKRCAKSFARACDMNADQLISRQEWAECLTRDGIDDVRGGQGNEDEEEEEEEGEDPFTPRPSPPHGVLSAESKGISSSYDDESPESKDDDATDCLSDRQLALGEQQLAVGEQHSSRRYELYVPECTPDGRYQKIQCYKSAGYCWCVHEDTGKNIPGTSVKNGTPKCDQLTIVSRPMKGCPDDKKRAFLKDLMQFLHTHMAAEMTNGSSMTSGNALAWKASKEEQAATWSFAVFDKNKNKALDRSEWKAFKETVIAVKNLKRCGKKLPRYCDINKDRQISMTEWLDCLNVHQAVTSATTKPSSVRQGKNPLSLLLDD